VLNVGGLTPCSTIDYPGELSAVIFCQGCPWRCVYCHNRHLLDAGIPGAVAWDDIVCFLEKRRGLLDAVVFSGGEPTMQPELGTAIRTVRSMGFKTGLHTAGLFPERLLECLPLLDWVGMDIKAPFEGYERITGAPGSGKAARKSADILRHSGVSHQFRSTLDPYLQTAGRIESMQRMVAAWGKELVLQRMNPMPKD
jgi:pyruvate formate lyase activating enzyme